LERWVWREVIGEVRVEMRRRRDILNLYPTVHWRDVFLHAETISIHSSIF
jgi:hypothetical protein